MHRFGHAVCSVGSLEWCSGADDSPGGKAGDTQEHPINEDCAGGAVNLEHLREITKKGDREENKITLNDEILMSLNETSASGALLAVFGGVDAEKDFGDFWLLKSSHSK